MPRASETTDESTEIIDGGDITLSCKDCDSKLLVLWITRPNAEFDWKIKANCPFCSGETNEQDVHGMFHYAPYFKITNEEDMESESKLYIETFTENNGVIEVLLRKHKK